MYRNSTFPYRSSFFSLLSEEKKRVTTEARPRQESRNVSAVSGRSRRAEALLLLPASLSLSHTVPHTHTHTVGLPCVPAAEL